MNALLTSLTTGLAALLRVIEGVMRSLAILTVFASAFVVALDVTLRRFLGHGVESAIDVVTSWCMPILAFSVLGEVYRRGETVSIDFVQPLLPRGARLWHAAIIHLAIAAVAGALAFTSADIAIGSWALGEYSPGVSRLPLWPGKAAVAAGSALLFATAVLLLATTLAKRNEQPTEQADL